jgi:CheY-like chemotaxis protein
MEIRPESAETILIVDDDELVRKSAVTLMASLGYRVLSFRSRKALAALARDTRMACPGRASASERRSGTQEPHDCERIIATCDSHARKRGRECTECVA